MHILTLRNPTPRYLSNRQVHIGASKDRTRMWIASVFIIVPIKSLIKKTKDKTDWLTGRMDLATQ